MICCALALAFSAIAESAELRNLRVWAAPDKTRAVLDLSGPVDYKLFTLSNPQRVVIDIDAASLNGDLQLPRDTSGELLSGVRHGQRGSDNLRVVLDLNQSVRPQSFLLKPAGNYGHRLVLDLFPAHEAEIPKPVKSLTVDSQRDVIVAIDAGHGGEDPGAIGPAGTHEKAVTLAIARELKKAIDAEPGMKAIMIRDGDYYIAHRERYEKAREARADLFVSIHADSFTDRRVRGSSVYILSRRGASSEAAQRLAEIENRADLIGGVSLEGKDDVLASVLLDLSQSATLQASHHVAEEVLSSLDSVGRTHKKHVESANFAVLRSPDTPSLLVETAFISNPEEEKRLRDASQQVRMAQAISDGVKRHFSRRPPPGTWLAANRSASEHVVSRGDTLSDIASRYSVSVERLKQANRLDNDRITIGSKLVIPAG
ncbi:MAG: N-acetylmuramoyl-L-alanine amidase AmiB [Wenzhouxiangellaceae bacterium]